MLTYYSNPSVYWYEIYSATGKYVSLSQVAYSVGRGRIRHPSAIRLGRGDKSHLTNRPRVRYAAKGKIPAPKSQAMAGKEQITALQVMQGKRCIHYVFPAAHAAWAGEKGCFRQGPAFVLMTPNQACLLVACHFCPVSFFPFTESDYEI